MQYIISATVPSGHQWSVSNAEQVCWSAGLWSLVLGEHQGGLARGPRDFFSHVFGHQFWDPPKSTFFVKWAPIWSQNALKKGAKERPRKHQKPTSSKKQQNSRNIIIYSTWAMLGTPQRHQFRTLKSYKIDEKTILEHKPLKKDKNYVQVTFFFDFGSQFGPLGARELTFSTFFEV